MRILTSYGTVVMFDDDKAYPLAAMTEDIGAVASAHIDHAFRRILRGPMVASDARFIRLLTGEAHPFGNMAIVSDPADPDGTEAAIGPLRAGDAPAAAMLPGPILPSVTDLLTRSGFAPQQAIPAMAVAISSLSSAAGLPRSYSFGRIGSGPDGDAWADAFALGYGLPRRVADAFSPNAAGATLAADASLQYFAVRKEGRIVATSLACLANGVAGVYCVSTIPAERGKGLGSYATAEPLRRVYAQGYRVGVLQASAAGHRAYRKLGFIDVGFVSLFLRIPS